MKLAFIIVVFILMNAFLIISNNNLYMKDAENIGEFFSLYVEWMGEIGENFAHMTGSAVKLDWIAEDG